MKLRAKSLWRHWCNNRWPEESRFFINASHGFSDSLLLFKFVCIEVDVLIIHLSFEMCVATNKILYLISFIPMKSLLLCSGGHMHLVSRKTKSLDMSHLTFQLGPNFRFDYMRFFQIFSAVSQAEIHHVIRPLAVHMFECVYNNKLEQIWLIKEIFNFIVTF